MKTNSLFKLLDTMYKNRKEEYLKNFNKAKSFSLDEIRHVNAIIKMDLSCTIFISIVISLLKDVFIDMINNALEYFNIKELNIGLHISLPICAMFLWYFISVVRKQTYKISILQDLQEDKKKELNNISTVQDELSVSLDNVINNENISNVEAIVNISNDEAFADISDKEETSLKPMNNKIKHLEMLQSVINRLANNSFTLKSWTITLVVAAITFISKTDDKKYMLIAYFPIVLFWVLSSYYLYLEKLFRELYNKVLTKEEKDIDFKMNIKDIEKKKNIYCKSLFAISQILFYFSSLIIVTLFLKYVGAL